jgi:hypothetical protein
MKDLDLLLKAKREEPTTVSIEVIDSWLKGGFVLVGLFAILKRLFTQKMWLMFTSISSITLVTILTFFHYSRPQADTFKKDKRATRDYSSRVASSIRYVSLFNCILHLY